MAKDCDLHAGKHNELRRRNLDEIMRTLPENQSGSGRHKCAYCAYERGFQDGLRSAANKLGQVILQEPTSKQMT